MGSRTGPGFRACCCCEPRTGALLVGIINLVVGTAGTTALYFILSSVSNEMHQLQSAESRSSKVEQRLDFLAEYYWSILLAYVFPTVVTFLLGLTVIFASAKNNECLLLISVFMNGILILASFAVSVLLYVLAVDLVLLSLAFAWGFVQLYFTWGLMNYRSTDLKTQIV